MGELKMLWPGWETIGEIGKGSFGYVYEIHRENFGTVEKAALKVISIPQSQADIDELYSNGYTQSSITEHFQNYLESIIREYTIMSEMRGHTNIVYCDDLKYIQHPDGIGWDIYIKMELLTPLVKKGVVQLQHLQEEQVIRLGRDICSALAFCRTRNIIHRDIKPQNIFVSLNGSYKLGDFGIAKMVEATASGTKAGTYNYMAPEVYKGEPYGASADIYSLGLVLYWLLNHQRLPFVSETPGASALETARVRRFRGDAIPTPAEGSGALKRIVLKACAYRTEDRYHSAEEMLRDLESLSGVSGADETLRTDPARFRLQQEETLRQQKETERIRLLEEENRRLEAENRRRQEAEKQRRKQEEENRKKRKRILEVCLVLGLLVFAAAAGWLLGSRDVPSETTPPSEKQTEAVTAPAQTAPRQTEHIHHWIPASCTAAKTCQSCGNTQGAALGHSWAEATYDSPKTCILCGITEGEPLARPRGNTVPPEGMIAAGNYHSVYLNPDGTVYAVGSREESQYANRSDRLDTGSWRSIVSISAASHTVGLREDGTVVAVGVDKYGQCNVGSWRDIVAIDAGDNHTVGLRSDGTVVAVGNNESGQCDVSGWKNIIAVAASEKTTYGLTEDGRVISAGSKNYGRTWSDIVAISAGPYHLVGLKGDGTIVQTGGCDQWDDQGKYWYDIVAVSAGTTHTVGLRSDGTVVACGGSSGDKGQCDVESWQDIVEICAGMFHTLGLKKDGTIVAVGNNAHGQLNLAG